MAPSIHIPSADLVDPPKGCQQDPTRLQDAVKCLNCCLYFINELQRLGQDDAVESVWWNMISASQVCHQGRLRVALRDVKHIASGDTIRSKLVCIDVIADFYDMSPYVRRVCGEIPLSI